MSSAYNDAVAAMYKEKNESEMKKMKQTSIEEQKKKLYENYYAKCMNTLNEIDEIDVERQCNEIQEKVNSRIEQIKSTFNTVLSSSNNEAFLENNKKEQNENYLKTNTELKNSLNILLEKVRSLEVDCPLDSIKKAKDEYESRNANFVLQPLITSLIEKRQFYNLVLKEKNSKQKVLEEKQVTFKENKQKIERLTKEYNTNSERVASELEINTKLQKEIDSLKEEIEKLKQLPEIKDHSIEDWEEYEKEYERKMMELNDVTGDVDIQKNIYQKWLNKIAGVSLLIKKELLLKEKVR